MCTAITMQSAQGDSYLGRTMDFSYELQPHLYAIPRGCRWTNAVTGEMLQSAYSFMGIGQELEGVLGLFDGVNERGFGAAALYFAGHARYDTTVRGQPQAVQVASYDLLRYILGQCASVEDLQAQLETLYIIGLPDPLTRTVAPLHWIAADRSGSCVVLEQTDRGVELFRNPLGVLANSPGLPWHISNLRNYMEASPRQREEVSWGGFPLTPFGQAGGTAPLPGGWASPARFARAAYLKTHSPTPASGEEAAVSFFQVMKGVSIPRGAVLTARGADDYTQYTALLNLCTGEYVFQTYDNLQPIRAEVPGAAAQQKGPVDLGPLAASMELVRLGRPGGASSGEP